MQNLPASLGKNCAKHLPSVRLLRVNTRKIDEESMEAVLVFEDQKAAEIAAIAVNNLTVEERKLSGNVVQLRDVGTFLCDCFA